MKRKPGGSRRKTTRVNRGSLRIVDVVHDGAIAVAGQAFGQLIPLFIVDTSDRPDIDELVRVHQFIEQGGDLKVQWGYLPDERAVAVTLDFIRPLESRATLYLPIQKYGGLIDRVLQVKLLLLQAGRAGDRLATTANASRLIVDAGSRKFEKEWDAIFEHVTAQYFREKGRTRRESHEMAAEAIERIRAMQNFSMPESNASSQRGLVITMPSDHDGPER